jgi:hypothetical protein
VLDGLKSKDAQLKAQMTALGKALVDAVRKGLNLKVTSGGLQLAGARALGGPVTAGRSYLVGETGPEIFTPRSSGGITPNGAGAGVIVVENHIEIGGEVVRVVRTEINTANRATKNAVLAGASRRF